MFAKTVYEKLTMTDLKEENRSLSDEQINLIGMRDISTPEMEYPWSQSQRRLIESHSMYHQEMVDGLQIFLQNGPDGISFPKAPTPSLKTLLGNVPKHNILVGEELHQYMTLFIVACQTQPPVCPRFSELQTVTLDTIVPYLKLGYCGVGRDTSIVTASYIEFGKYLNCAFELYQRAKWNGSVTVSWESWLKEQLAIHSTSYSRKLREIAKLFGDYPKMYYLAMPFSEIYQRRRQIDNMFFASEEIKAFWKST